MIRYCKGYYIPKEIALKEELPICNYSEEERKYLLDKEGIDIEEYEYPERQLIEGKWYEICKDEASMGDILLKFECFKGGEIIKRNK